MTSIRSATGAVMVDFTCQHDRLRRTQYFWVSGGHLWRGQRLTW